MAVYIVNLAVIGYLSAISKVGARSTEVVRERQKLFSLVVGLMLFSVLAFRSDTVGVDLKVYLKYWSLAENQNISEVSRFEPGFLALTEYSRAISDSPHFFLAVVACLSIAPVSFVIHRHSSLPLMSWLIYICLGFYAFTFSGLRQAIAFAFVILAIHFIRNRKPLSFLGTVVIAWTFHASALVFLPAYWIYWVRIGRVGIAIYLALIPLVFVFRQQIFLSFTELFYSDYEVSPSSSYNWLLISALFVAFGWTRYYFLRRDSSLDEGTLKSIAGLLQLATIGVSLMLFASVGTNVLRMADYYYMAIILALPAVINTFSAPQQSIIKFYLVPGLIIIYLYRLLNSPYLIVPYSTF